VFAAVRYTVIVVIVMNRMVAAVTCRPIRRSGSRTPRSTACPAPRRLIPAITAPPIGDVTRFRGRASSHPDDEFHPPTSDDPAVDRDVLVHLLGPERRLRGQLYPFFVPNQGVARAALFLGRPWRPAVELPLREETSGHLALDDQPLSDLRSERDPLPTVSSRSPSISSATDDPDGGDEVHVDLTFTAVTPPHYLGESHHLDQPGRYEGTITLDGERIDVDSFGFRDRSWGCGPSSGRDCTSSPAPCGGYSYATASPRDGFHSITMDFGDGCINIHGYLLRDGEWSTLTQGRRESWSVTRRPASRGGCASTVWMRSACAARRRAMPEPARTVPQPEPVHRQLSDRVALRRDHRLRGGPRQLERPGRPPVLPPPARLRPRVARGGPA